MNKLLLPAFFVATFLLSPAVNAQLTNMLWADQSHGGQWEDASSVATDELGGVYVTGYYSNDTCLFQDDTLYNAGSADMYLVKYDLAGTVIWARHAGGSADEYGLSVACDLNGVVVAGNFSSASVIFGNDTLINSGSGTPDMFIVKYDLNGNVLWAKREGCTDWDNAAAVTVDAISGDIYLAGAFFNADFIAGTDTIYNAAMYDMVVMKLSPSGNNIWARGAGGNYNDLANAIVLDGIGNVYISGGFASDTLLFPTDTLVNAFGSMPDIFVVRYDTSGNEIWALREGGADNDHSVAITINSMGDLFVSGHYHSSSFTVGTDTLNNAGMGDVFLLKYDMLGNPAWALSFGGSDHDFGYTITADNNTGVLVAGMFMSVSMTVGPNTLINASMDEDMFLVQITNTGSVVLAEGGGGTGRDFLNSVLVCGGGEMIVAGGFSSVTLPINSPGLSNTDPSGSTGDAFIARRDFPMIVPAFSTDRTVQVYPNPGNGLFTFTSNEVIETITVYNSLGQEVKVVQNGNAPTCRTDLSDQADGLYFYSVVNTKGEIISGTLIKHL